ncbi:MAG: carbamoyltransferase HypF [Dehalococcoidales bacterium]|nr:carbamoyltransferase HypF [Dehalococcoidales bacterium]
MNPADRRYRYPFTNCTNCGPRFTIIEDIPYDRPATTMKEFKMCPDCRKEYDDPGNRRFHAQPNACPVCGPRLELVDNYGRTVPTGDAIKKAATLLKAGKILAIKGLGGFQLACDATNPQAAQLLRDRKRRPAKPFAVMMATIDDILIHCRLSAAEEQLLMSPAAPIVLVGWDNKFSDITAGVAPGLNNLGVMLPYTPLHHLLLRETRLPLVMTSGNLSEEPIARDNEEALERLKDIADYFLRHNRDIRARYDDSVFVVENKKPVALRRARGYAPYPIHLPYTSKQILACGAELKNTFCLTRDDHAFISQHIGDMENTETLEHYENTLELYKKLFRIKPEIVACDLHPEYLPSKYAIEYAASHNLPLVKVQHHHAHIVSCMAENGIEEPVIGVAFDGAGYGTDGHIWGGEFLVADRQKYQRAGQLEYVPMPGGALAIKKTYRMALGYIYSLLGQNFPLEGLAFSKIPASELTIIKQQIAKGLNAPLTSSAGRLFDAVAAITGVCFEASYEAQAAIELEMRAPQRRTLNQSGRYPFTIDEKSGIKTVRLGKLMEAVIGDVRNNMPVAHISLKLHLTMAEIAVEMCREISRETGIKSIALSGGVFQNRLLLKLTSHKLKEAGFKVFTHHLAPCNDGGISLGQAVNANQARK